ncbi:hypothetical protein [Yunchengibacter salinarum]|uniref:hypothetical protein n=1 Tax=Yunchengibacter salinarum TaxID=3133399 RepID=UPI0035B63870
MKNLVLTALMLGMLASLPARADDRLARAQAAFDAGAFETAADLGRASDTADGLSLACRSGLIRGGWQTEGPEMVTILHQAIRDCENAVIKEPTHLVGKLSLALAVGFEGKRRKKAGYADAAKDHLKTLVQLYPDHPDPWGALAGWHAEVSKEGFMARLVLGARPSKAHEFFETALKKGSVDGPFMLEYCKFLARLGPVEQMIAESHLNTMLEKPAHTALLKIVRGKARKLKEALASGKKTRIADAIEAASAFPDIEKHDKVADTLDLKDLPEPPESALAKDAL